MNSAGAPTLLLIHGFLDDSTIWDGLVDCLAGEVASVRYDLPGFGARSGSLAEARTATLESLAAEAGEILSGIDGPVIVVGQSLGTQVAELVAAQHSDQVRGLVLLTPVPLGGTQLPDEVVAPFAALGGDRVAQLGVRTALSPNLIGPQLDRLTDIGVPVAAEVTAHYTGLWNRGVSDAPTKSAFDGPVLIVRGGADGFVTKQLVDAISPRFVEPEVKVIDEGGHWIHAEYPGCVAAMVLDFTDAVVGGDIVSPSLEHKVFVTKQIPQSGRGPLPDGSTRMWSPITTTLIMGRHDAVLVDPPLTTAQAAEVGDWVTASGRELRQIYLTHGHGDHWFGAIPLLQRFPGVTVRATEGTAKLMEAQNAPQFRAEFWDRVFPGQVPAGQLDVTVVDERGFELEGLPLLPVEVGHTDTDATTMLHVPEMGLLVAGDVVYNGVHLYLTESGGVTGIDEWLAALDTAAALNPATVIAGHKDPRAFDNPTQIQATRRYLTDARRLLESSETAEVFYESMLRLHPNRINPGALWGAAVTLFPTP